MSNSELMMTHPTSNASDAQRSKVSLRQSTNDSDLLGAGGEQAKFRRDKDLVNRGTGVIQVYRNEFRLIRRRPTAGQPGKILKPRAVQPHLWFSSNLHFTE